MLDSDQRTLYGQRKSAETAPKLCSVCLIRPQRCAGKCRTCGDYFGRNGVERPKALDLPPKRWGPPKIPLAVYLERIADEERQVAIQRRKAH